VVRSRLLGIAPHAIEARHLVVGDVADEASEVVARDLGVGALELQQKEPMHVRVVERLPQLGGVEHVAVPI
jgi:hypothetical protein